jgi:hypothetical protein
MIAHKVLPHMERERVGITIIFIWKIIRKNRFFRSLVAEDLAEPLGGGPGEQVDSAAQKMVNLS